MRRPASLFLGLVLALAGCAADESGEPRRERGAAAVSFVVPAEGDTVGPSFTVRVRLEGFEIDARGVGGPGTPGKGHLRFSLDGGRFDDAEHAGANGVLAEKLRTAGRYSPAVKPEITYRRIPPGVHTLRVELVAGDDSEIGVEASARITVE